MCELQHLHLSLNPQRCVFSDTPTFPSARAARFVARKGNKLNKMPTIFSLCRRENKIFLLFLFMFNFLSSCFRQYIYMCVYIDQMQIGCSCKPFWKSVKKEAQSVCLLNPSVRLVSIPVIMPTSAGLIPQDEAGESLPVTVTYAATDVKGRRTWTPVGSNSRAAI